tara:strand:+ start:404 stop:517 length:114 start_codon:yes stop_codon:yes gene_type:complete
MEEVFFKTKDEDSQVWFLRYPMTPREKLGAGLKLFKD